MSRDQANQVVIDGLHSNTQYQIQAIAITSTGKRSLAPETMIKATERGIYDLPVWSIVVIVGGCLILLLGVLGCIWCCRK